MNGQTQIILKTLKPQDRLHPVSRAIGESFVTILKGENANERVKMARERKI